MKIRKFEIDHDLESMKNWVTDERMHAMWCANLIKYPLSEEHMAETMAAVADRFGDIPYVIKDLVKIFSKKKIARCGSSIV